MISISSFTYAISFFGKFIFHKLCNYFWFFGERFFCHYISKGQLLAARTEKGEEKIVR